MHLVSDRSYKKEEVKSILKKIFLTRIDFFDTSIAFFFDKSTEKYKSP